MRERGRSPFPELPPALREHFRTVETGAVTTETNLGTALIVKVPIATAARLVGEVPIGIDHQLFNRPSAPVIRMVTAFYDQAGDPLVFETFFNIGHEQQRREYEGLTKQEELPILIHDEELEPVFAKRVRIPNGEEIRRILATADGLYAATWPELFDFDRAKQEVMERTDLRPFPYRLGSDPF
jgi:hypothetical protein